MILTAFLAVTAAFQPPAAAAGRTFDLVIQAEVHQQNRHPAARLRPLGVQLANDSHVALFECRPDAADANGSITCTLTCDADHSPRIVDANLILPDPPIYDRPAGINSIEFHKQSPVPIILDHAECHIGVRAQRVYERTPSGMRMQIGYIPKTTFQQGRYWPGGPMRVASMLPPEMEPAHLDMWQAAISEHDPDAYVEDQATIAQIRPQFWADALESAAELNYLARLTGDDEVALWTSQVLERTRRRADAYLLEPAFQEDISSMWRLGDADRLYMQAAERIDDTQTDVDAIQFASQLDGLGRALQSDRALTRPTLERYRGALDARAALTNIDAIQSGAASSRSGN